GDLGRRPDRRARVVAHAALLDRDRRREALDRVDVGPRHLVEELPRVGGERLDVATLALGVDRVEGESRLPRAGEAGHHDEAIARGGPASPAKRARGLRAEGPAGLCARAPRPTLAAGPGGGGLTASRPAPPPRRAPRARAARAPPASRRCRTRRSSRGAR